MEQETKDLFREEVDETLAELDASLLELEKTPDDLELVNRVFRAVHTLKGACDMFGVDNVVALAHEMESVFDLVRNGARRVDKPLLDAGFAARDRIGNMLREGVEPGSVDASDLIAVFRGIASPPSPSGMAGGTRRARLRGGPAACASFPPEKTASRARTLSIFWSSWKASASAGFWPTFPVCRNCARSTPSPAMRASPSISPRPARKTTSTTCFCFWRTPASCPSNPPVRRPLRAPPKRRSGPGPRRPPPSETPVCAAPAGERADNAPAAAAKRAPVRAEVAQSLRVDAGKLDELVNLVGELVIAQARLTQLSGHINHPSLTGVAEEIERLSNELRDNTLSIRMLPIGTTFSRFRRLVRDLSSEMQKRIELVTDGGETELDKTVLEQLNDPLVHLLRNSIDHGIESPGERMASGKRESGRITLSARHAGGEVLIRITDDGKGMDPEAIRRKALEKGLVGADAKLTESEIFNLIFLPGFSTAEKVTNISGRGVGMDVVKRSMDALRGKIDVQSKPGEGTEITIKLPLTLAIIDGLQVMTAGEHYIIPLAVVEECVELSAGRKEDGGRKRSIHLRGEMVPYIRLREAFALSGKHPAIEQVVVTRHESGRTGIAVDEVIGQQQTVIKSLGAYIGNVEGISGATINGDGTMSLILDVPTLVQSARRKRG